MLKTYRFRLSVSRGLARPRWQGRTNPYEWASPLHQSLCSLENTNQTIRQEAFETLNYLTFNFLCERKRPKAVIAPTSRAVTRMVGGLERVQHPPRALLPQNFGLGRRRPRIISLVVGVRRGRAARRVSRGLWRRRWRRLRGRWRRQRDPRGIAAHLSADLRTGASSP